MTASTSLPTALPQWLRVPDAVRLFGIGKSTLYVLMAEGKIKSSLISGKRAKASTGKRHGTRLVSAASLDTYISSHVTGDEAAPAKKGRKRQ